AGDQLDDVLEELLLQVDFRVGGLDQVDDLLRLQCEVAGLRVDQRDLPLNAEGGRRGAGEGDGRDHHQRATSSTSTRVRSLRPAVPSGRVSSYSRATPPTRSASSRARVSASWLPDWKNTVFSGRITSARLPT